MRPAEVLPPIIALIVIVVASWSLVAAQPTATPIDACNVVGIMFAHVVTLFVAVVALIVCRAYLKRLHQRLEPSSLSMCRYCCVRGIDE